MNVEYLKPAEQVVEFKMVAFPTSARAAVIIFRDGLAQVVARNAQPGHPLIVEVEGHRHPNHEQLVTLKLLWAAMKGQFRYEFRAEVCENLARHMPEFTTLFAEAAE